MRVLRLGRRRGVGGRKARREAKLSAGYKWQALQRGEALPPSEALIKGTMAYLGCSREMALASIAQEDHDEIWINDLYQVVVHRHDGGLVHLNIRRRDGYPGRDWRHFQQIKNELVGTECEGVEVYPAESRLADTSNKYHLWCFDDPAFRFPFGFSDRRVDYNQSDVPGHRQRPPMQMRRKA
jgi:hypothetical protein